MVIRRARQKIRVTTSPVPPYDHQDVEHQVFAESRPSWSQTEPLFPGLRPFMVPTPPADSLIPSKFSTPNSSVPPSIRNRRMSTASNLSSYAILPTSSRIPPPDPPSYVVQRGDARASIRTTRTLLPNEPPRDARDITERTRADEGITEDNDGPSMIPLLLERLNRAISRLPQMNELVEEVEQPPEYRED